MAVQTAPSTKDAEKGAQECVDVTAVILTYNEEIHIGRCIQGLAGFAQRVVVVDSFSDDGTIDLARSLGAEIYQNPFVSHAAQFQWALDNCDIRTGWTLRVDADEYLEPALKEELRQSLPTLPGTTNGVYLRRKTVFLGRPILHGFFYPLHIMRLWRTGSGRMEQRWMDEHIVLHKPQTIVSRHDLVDHNLKDVTWWIQKHNDYATREMFELAKMRHGVIGVRAVSDASDIGNGARGRWKQRLYAKIPSTLRPLLYFLYRYVVGRGFLDGKEGFYFHLMQAFWYRSLVELKLREVEIEAERDGVSVDEAVSRHHGRNGTQMRSLADRKEPD